MATSACFSRYPTYGPLISYSPSCQFTASTSSLRDPRYWPTLTCDCDGKIDQFATPEGISRTLDLHALEAGEDYYLSVFLVGAYQETLGDLHNLFGDTNVVNVAIDADGTFEFDREFHGDSISDVLSYVEYEPKQMQEKFRLVAEDAVRSGKISIAQRQEILRAFKESLSRVHVF